MRRSLPAHPLRTAAALAVIVLALPSEGSAQQAGRPKPGAGDLNGDDHAMVFELGAAADWSRSEPVRPGGTFAVEVTPIERWLELETGVTVIRADRTTETSIDLLFKKPWRVSRTFEFMAGAGPEIVHSTGNGGATFGGLTIVADFMIWPRTNIGWYVEPGYEATFRNGGTRHGLGIAAGVLFGR
jgi:hypothetical protein